MTRVLIYFEVVFLVLLSGASLTDARRATLPVYLSPSLALGFFFCNLAISGAIIFLNSMVSPDRTHRRGRERLWSVLAAWILGGATIFAMLPFVN